MHHAVKRVFLAAVKNNGARVRIVKEPTVIDGRYFIVPCRDFLKIAVVKLHGMIFIVNGVDGTVPPAYKTRHFKKNVSGLIDNGVAIMRFN